MTGDTSCEWQSWFKTHNTGYDKVLSDFDLAKWKVEHTRLLRELRMDLQGKSTYTYLEGQNQFRYDLPSGATISGTPDLICHGRDQIITVYDAKTGQQRASDQIQVMLYMHFLPMCHDRYKNKSLDGCVVYNLQNRVSIDVKAVDKSFLDNVDYYLNILSSTTSPLKAPSKGECKMCDIPIADCPERIQ